MSYYFNFKVIDTLSLPSVPQAIAGSTTSHNSITTDNLCNEMNHLMHDYQVITRIVDLASTLKGSYLVSIGLNINKMLYF